MVESPRFRYEKAPVIEAVIEFRFAQPLGDSDPDRIARRLEGKFPNKSNVVDVGVQVSPQGVGVNQSQNGFRLTANDGLRIVIVSKAHIVSSVLAPYVGWDELRQQSEVIISAANAIVGRPRMSRIGVRYINRLDIPGTDVDMAEWIRLSVTPPPELGQNLAEFTGRIVLPRLEGIVSALMFQSVPSPLIDHTSVLLDIDNFIDQEVPLSDEALWTRLEEIRNRKNSIFEFCITEKTRLLFGNKVQL